MSEKNVEILVGESLGHKVTVGLVSDDPKKLVVRLDGQHVGTLDELTIQNLKMESIIMSILKKLAQKGHSKTVLIKELKKAIDHYFLVHNDFCDEEEIDRFLKRLEAGGYIVLDKKTCTLVD